MNTEVPKVGFCSSTARHAIGLTAMLLLVVHSAAAQNAASNLLLPSADESRFRYETDYPAIGYSTVPPSERIAVLQGRLDHGKDGLEYNETNGYLASVLEALEIDPASQLLVFSRTSLNVAYIRPETPRAIFFNDDAYVAWVPGSGMLEIATMDPKLGPVFFVLEQDRSERPRFDRQTVQCLRCHDSFTLTGDGVPRFILGSGYVDTRGNLVSHEGWILTNQETPLKFRWGGWYVTGEHGEQPHLGNIVVKDAASLQELDSLRIYNKRNLADSIDTKFYPTSFSDIVALLVIEHQVHVQNLITRVNYDVRSALAAEKVRVSIDNKRNEWSVTEEMKSLIEEAAEPLVQAMLFAREANLASPISGSTEFGAQFEARGPFDKKGRSLRQFDLHSRIFRYPLSYLIYSEAFDNLPQPVKNQVYRRLADVLGSDKAEPVVARLRPEERATMLDILRDTNSDFVSATMLE